MSEPGTILEAFFLRDQKLKCVVIPKRYPIEDGEKNLRVVLMEKGSDPVLIVGRVFYIDAKTFQWQVTEHTAIKLLKRSAMLNILDDAKRSDFFTIIDEG